MQDVEGAKVTKLLKMNMNECDYDLLRDVFNQEDIGNIIKIPIFFFVSG